MKPQLPAASPYLVVQPPLGDHLLGEWSVDGNNLFPLIVRLDYKAAMLAGDSLAPHEAAHKYCLQYMANGIVDGAHYLPHVDPARPRCGPHTTEFVVEFYPMLLPGQRDFLRNIARRFPQFVCWEGVRQVPESHRVYLPRELRVPPRGV